MTRRVVVTGGTRGIGKAVADRFAARGDTVTAFGRADCDVTDEDAVAAFFAGLGPVDVLVNNAGTATSAPLARTSTVDWRSTMDANALGPFLCTRAVLPGMLERDHGRVVTVASTAGLHGSKYTAAYTAAKHAAVGLMRVVAAEVQGTGVTSNAVCPAFVRTDMTAESVRRIVERTNRTPDEAERLLGGPLGRLIEPDEVADAVLYLAGAAAVNGHTLALDGGGPA